MIGFKRALLRVGFAALVAHAAQPAGAQSDAAANFPNRPIRLIVGFAAGGGNDLFARLVGQKLSDNIGQPVIIENKAGAGGRIAVEYVKNQPADGYTIMVAASGQMAIAAAIYPKLSYHPTRDFLPLTMIASFPLILAGPANDTIKSVKDLVAYCKANPDTSTYATSSLNAGSHTIKAIFVGDATFKTSAKSLTESVKLNPSATTLISSLPPSNYGQSVTFTATVSSTYGPIPDGEPVIFFDGTTPLASVSLAGGVASYTTSSLSVANHVIKATYAGDTTFAISAKSLQQVVKP